MVIPDTNRNNYWYLVISVQELPQICPMESHRTCFQYWPVLHCSQVPANCTNQAQYSAPPSHVDARTRAPRTHTHTHPFNSPLSGTIRVSRYQKSKTNLYFTEAKDSEWQWHQLGHMQVCTSLQTDNHASTPPLSFFTGRMPFLPPNQQHWSTEGNVDACLE